MNGGCAMTRYSEPARTAAGPTPCDRCGGLVLRQLVGQRAALRVVADAEPIPLARALALTEPNRLAWCLAVLRSGTAELRWRCKWGCGHATVIEHRCPEGTPSVAGALW